MPHLNINLGDEWLNTMAGQITQKEWSFTHNHGHGSQRVTVFRKAQHKGSIEGLIQWPRVGD